MLKLADLALRPDFQIGPMLVSPSRRLVEGPGGYVHVEPLIMQVFLLLVDGAGRVVTRNELFDQCWGGVFVGDDSLNRAIAKVRRIGAQVTPGLYEIETIPRTGYRLTGEILNYLGEGSPDDDAKTSSTPAASRRALIASGAAAVAVAGAGGLWWTIRSGEDARFNTLMRQASDAMRANSQFDPEKASNELEKAVQIRPDSARAWGLLALVRSVRAQGRLAQDGPESGVTAAIVAAQDSAQRALAINPREPNALLAMFELQGSTLDWWTRDQRLRQIIAIDPANALAIGELVLMLQAAGYSRESWNWNERALAIEPLSEDFLAKRAMKLWIAGRISASDKVIDQLRVLYPTSPWSWWVRCLIYALTDRPRAAQAMLDSSPAMLGKPETALWRPALEALARPSTENVARARTACAAGARISGDLAGEGVMILSALGDADGAFRLANGFLLSRGSIVRNGTASGAQSDAVARINTQWLFTPPCALMRADQRFLPLCDGIGLVEYWRRRGMQPDYQLTER